MKIASAKTQKVMSFIDFQADANNESPNLVNDV
jgi:hypothetical protein